MTKDEVLGLAKQYIESGISLIPAGQDKRPLIEWKKYQDEKATIEQVGQWYDQFPNMQLGGVTGKISNLIVVDVENGGDTSWLPKTAIAKTGGDGYHYYYSYVPGMTNKVRIRHLTDIRSDGGFVVLPGSTTTKGTYEWIVKARPTIFPKSLFVSPEINFYDKVETDYPGYGDGQRNDQMTKYIGHMLAKIHPSEWNNIAWPLITMANKKNTPPLPESELKGTFDSITNLERRNNNDRWYKKEDPTKVTESNLWKEEDNKILLMKDIAGMEQYKQGDRYETRFPLFDAALGGGLEDGDLIIISGLTGFGKTQFSSQMAVNFAEQGLPVLFISYEVKVSHLWNKFKEMGIDENLPIYSIQKNTSGNVGWVEEKIKEAEKEYQIKMVVIDHLGFLLPKSSMKDISTNYSVYIGQICRDLKQIAMRENIIIIMPVHLRKTDDPTINDLGNSSGIGQESDAVIILHRERNKDIVEGDVYNENTKVMMVKNRKTGQSVQGYYKLENGRFTQNNSYFPIPNTPPVKKPWKRFDSE